MSVIIKNKDEINNRLIKCINRQPIINANIKHIVKCYCSNNIQLKKLIINKYGIINKWNVSQVTDMRSMFESAIYYNQSLNNWDVSSVTDMVTMFDNAQRFNQPLNNWNVSNVTNMRDMFGEPNSFNQPLNNWDVSNVTDMDSMFESV